MGVEAVDQLLDGKSNIVICEVDGKITTCDIGKALRVDRLFKGKCTPEEIAAFDPEEKKRGFSISASYAPIAWGGKVINVPNERCTFLEALAMSGGLDWYTRRDRIGVMREVDGKRVIHYLDPRSTEIFNDEFFVLQQNDIIFTEEMSYKFFSNNLGTVLSLVSAVTSLVSVFVLVRSLWPTNGGNR